MGITIPGRVVVFDYGEVISTAPGEADRRELVALAGSDPAEFWEVYWRHRGAFDQGAVTARAYWRAIERDLGSAWDAARIHRLWLADFRSWLTIDRGTLDVLIDLHRGGTRLALLSNAARDFASYYRHGMLGEFFEQVFLSSELGVLKPHPEIFQMLLSGLAARPDEVVFIDNLEDNVRGAESLGITSHRFTGADNLRRYLCDVAAQLATRHDPLFPTRSRPA
jgi:putative hydrolase of the HAD superfamily